SLEPVACAHPEPPRKGDSVVLAIKGLGPGWPVRLFPAEPIREEEDAACEEGQAAGHRARIDFGQAEPERLALEADKHEQQTDARHEHASKPLHRPFPFPINQSTNKTTPQKPIRDWRNYQHSGENPAVLAGWWASRLS